MVNKVLLTYPDSFSKKSNNFGLDLIYIVIKAQDNQEVHELWILKYFAIFWDIIKNIQTKWTQNIIALPLYVT